MQLLQCVHFVMPSTQTIYHILYFYLQISCSITPNLIHIPCLHWRSYCEQDHYDGSFGSSSNQFTCFFRGFGLFSIVRLVAPTFLVCWSQITLTFIICFQQNDRPIFLNKMTHNETNIFPSNQHYKILELYYSKVSILRFPFLKVF